MSALSQQPYLTPDQYLQIEETAIPSTSTLMDNATLALLLQATYLLCSVAMSEALIVASTSRI